jgi:hypothetical protein
MSYTTRLTPRTSLMIRLDVLARTSSGQPRPVGGHAVRRADGPDGHDVVVGPLVPHDAHRADGQEDREGLPELVVETGLEDLLLHDGIRVAHDA